MRPLVCKYQGMVLVELERIKPFFPRSYGVSRIDELKVLSGIMYVIKHGLQWKDAPHGYGPYKTLYNRFVRWSRLGAFNTFLLNWQKQQRKMVA